RPPLLGVGALSAETIAAPAPRAERGVGPLHLLVRRLSERPRARGAAPPQGRQAGRRPRRRDPLEAVRGPPLREPQDRGARAGRLLGHVDGPREARPAPAARQASLALERDGA